MVNSNSRTIGYKRAYGTLIKSAQFEGKSTSLINRAGEYWMGAGCDRRINFQHLACQNVRTVSRSVQLGYVQERHAMQRVCVCTRDMCNEAGGYDFPIVVLSQTLAIVYLLLR
ncbi:unnamed protein product [Nippostrongylus brasiliensis]|uniref:Protein Wnt n=1 Tax=Nippostrongylus brasiliensis TaxID=27835 RepID=A0A0N4XFJ8_NIPBR|nr:unnamed protein product [Nippostrongylus brasiliensis]